MTEPLLPPGGTELDGYVLIRRGCIDGWAMVPELFYRCAQCGDLIEGDCRDNRSCTCTSMILDADAGRFGSRLGDENILTYRRFRRPQG